jgi:hypothetical protein
VNEDRLVRVAQTGDEAARAELLEAAAPFIRSMARHYRTSGTGQRELVRAGKVGLLRAYRRQANVTAGLKPGFGHPALAGPPAAPPPRVSDP